MLVQKDLRITHGMHGTKLYKVWASMRRRCYDKESLNYPAYGGRGIRVCPHWKIYFRLFCEDMHHDYKPGLQLHRIDNDGDYQPSNCKWVTAKENCLYRRSSRRLTAFGKTQTISQWTEETGLGDNVIHRRLQDGCTDEEAITPGYRGKYNSIKITARGKTMGVKKWALDTGIPEYILRTRIRMGWAHEKIISVAPRKLKKS